MTRITDWRSSSFSGGENNDCVQVANTIEALRDSKNPDGGVLRVDVHDLVDAITTGRLRR
jgi:hypothetical protein